MKLFNSVTLCMWHLELILNEESIGINFLVAQLVIVFRKLVVLFFVFDGHFSRTVQLAWLEAK